MPLVVFLVLAILLVMLVGIACAWLAENPMQASERLLTVLAQLPAVPVAWSLALSTLLLVWPGGRAARRPWPRVPRSSAALPLLNS